MKSEALAAALAPAVASLVVNTPMWRIKASFVAREALRYHFVQGPHERAEAQRRAVRTAVAAHR